MEESGQRLFDWEPLKWGQRLAAKDDELRTRLNNGNYGMGTIDPGADTVIHSGC